MTPRARLTAPGALLGMLGVGLVAAAGGLALIGADAPPPLLDPGPVVRWALPVIKVGHDLAAASTVGGLLVCACLVRRDSPQWTRARSLAEVAAVAWSLLAVAVLVLTAASAGGLALTDPGYSDVLRQYSFEIEAGRLSAFAAAGAAVVALLTAAVRSAVGAGLTLAGVVVALVPVALNAHAGSESGHQLATSSMWLHLIGTTAWAGGLIAIVALGGPSRWGAELRTVATRFSAIAVWGFVLVAVSGFGGAVVRLGDWQDVGTRYGALLALKAAALLALGTAGWWHRGRLLPALDVDAAPARARRAFVLLVSGELVVMSLAIGLGVALSRSTPPQTADLGGELPSPAEVISGYPLPPPLSIGRLLGETSVDIIWLVVAAALAVSYLRWVLRLRARGDRWPLHRTILWLLGCVSLVAVTSGGLAVYGRVFFSVHMVQHMALSMLVPLFLVLAAPITLALRALTARRDGSLGPREFVLRVVESPLVRTLGHPVVAAVIFAASMIGFYFTPVFGLALTTHTGHELMMVHFLLAGYLFANGLIGVDPGPSRPAYPLRLLLLFATMAFHAFFGVGLASTTTLLEATYFSSLGTGIDALADQQEGGYIAWGLGELPTLLIALVLVVQWIGSDSRETRRSDRADDRDGDSRLNEYNAMLSRLGDRDG